ncbi:MAG: oligosaccharide flippase family protein [Candidatus Odinarchaeota archaeon]
MVITRLTKSRFYVRIKRSDFFDTMKHSQKYFFASIVSTGLSFISIPVFTRLFTREDYGIVSVFNAYLLIFAVLLTANCHSSVGRYYFEEKPDFNEFLGTTLILVVSVFSVCAFLLLLFYDQIARLMNLPEILLMFLLFTSFFTIFYDIYLQILNAQKRSSEYAAISIANGAFTLGLAIILVLLLAENRYLGRIWASFLVGIIFSIYCFFKIVRISKFAVKKEHIKYILIFSVPLIPYTLSAVILAFFDRIFINYTIDSAAAGVYSVGYAVASLLSMVIAATQTALMPDFFGFLNRKQYARLDSLVSRVFAIVTIAALGLILFARDIIVILADVKFHEGLVVIPIVVIGLVFYGMYTVYGRYITYMKKNIYVSLVMIFSGIVNIILNVVFIPEYGYIAGAYTTVVSYFLLFITTWVVAKRIFKEKMTPLWGLGKSLLIMFGFLGASVVVGSMVTDVTLIFVIKFVLLVFFCICVFHRELKRLLSG